MIRKFAYVLEAGDANTVLKFCADAGTVCFKYFWSWYCVAVGATGAAGLRWPSEIAQS